MIPTTTQSTQTLSARSRERERGEERRGEERRERAYFCDPGTEWRSKLIRNPYFLLHFKAFKKSRLALTSHISNLAHKIKRKERERERERECVWWLTFPTGFLQEWFSVPFRNGPIRYWDSNPIQTTRCDPSEIFFRLFSHLSLSRQLSFSSWREKGGRNWRERGNLRWNSHNDSLELLRGILHHR